MARALSQRFPAVDPAPMSSLGGQISPPGARHKSGGWRVLSMPLDEGRRFDTQLSWKYDGRDPGEDRPGAVRVVVRLVVEKATGRAA